MPSSARPSPVHSLPTRRSSDLHDLAPLGTARARQASRPEAHPAAEAVDRAEADERAADRALAEEHRGDAGARKVAQRVARLSVERSEEHTSELQSLRHLVCRLLPAPLPSTLSLHDALPICTTSHRSGRHARGRRPDQRRTQRPRRSTAPRPTNAPPIVLSRKSTVATRVPGRSRSASPACPSRDRKSTRLNSSHLGISYAVFCPPLSRPLSPYTTLFRSARPRTARDGTRAAGVPTRGAPSGRGGRPRRGRRTRRRSCSRGRAPWRRGCPEGRAARRPPVRREIGRAHV